MDDDQVDYEGNSYFTGNCTCDHDQEEHGWCGCNVEGCECEAHWEE